MERPDGVSYWHGLTCTLCFIFSSVTVWYAFRLEVAGMWICVRIRECTKLLLAGLFFFLFVDVIYVIWKMHLNIVASEIAWKKKESKASWKKEVVGLPPNDHCLSAWKVCLLKLMFAHINVEIALKTETWRKRFFTYLNDDFIKSLFSSPYMKFGRIAYFSKSSWSDTSSY